MKTDRFEVIDASDIIVATTQTLSDAQEALRSFKAFQQWGAERAYIYDTQTRKVVK